MARGWTPYLGLGTPRTVARAAGCALPRWERDPRVLWRFGPGLVVLLARDSVAPTSLSGTGVALWAALDEPRTIRQLAARLAAEFGADLDVVESDIEPVVASLAAIGALRSLP
jgi:hypothetical protein